MSVSRLLMPSRRTLRWIFGAGASPAPDEPGASGPPGAPAAFGAGRSRTDEYTGPPGLGERITTSRRFQASVHCGPLVVSTIGPWLRRALRSQRALCPKRAAVEGQTAPTRADPIADRAQFGRSVAPQ